MMALPFAVFWVVIVAGRKELGWKGAGIFVATWTALLLAMARSNIDGHFFIAAQAILDAILVSTIYLSFTRLR